MMIALVYIVLLTTCIYYLPFFKDRFIHRTAFAGAFLLKVLAGFGLTYIYTCYYTDRSTADIYKYYDDAKIMYNALYEHPADYFKMLFGVGNDNAYFDSHYYAKMNHWCRRYDFGTYNDNHTIIRFNALVMLIAFGSFHVHTVLMCFVSFLGLSALYKSFCQYFPDKKNFIYAAVFLVPSVVFWGSGVLKEGILLFATGFLVYTFFQVFIFRKFTLWYLVLFCLSVVLQLVNKNYLLLALCPPLLCYFMVQYFRIRKIIFFFFIAHGIVFITGYGLLQLMNKAPLQSLVNKRRDFINLSHGGIFVMNDKVLIRVDPERKTYLDTLGNDHFRMKAGSSYMYWRLDNFNDTLYISNSADTSVYNLVWDLPVAGSALKVSQLEPHLFSFFKHIPEALYISFLQPLIYTAGTYPEKMAALENIGILFCLFIGLIFTSRNKVDVSWLMLCGWYVLILYLIIGFTTPVAGAIVRYKVPALPFLLLMAVNLADVNVLRSRFRKLI